MDVTLTLADGRQRQFPKVRVKHINENWTRLTPGRGKGDPIELSLRDYTVREKIYPERRKKNGDLTDDGTRVTDKFVAIEYRREGSP